MPTWPATLPQLGQIGAGYKPQDAVARSRMDAGPPSRRNRSTATTKDVDYQMPMTGAQAAILESFHENTLRNGALSGLLGGSASAGPLAGQPLFDIASSFDGGGYTGSGARTGGLDGRGGFMAMMHPQERVYDETRGQGRNQGGVVNNIKVIAPEGSKVDESRQQNSTGGEDLTVMIDREVSSLARDPSSAISRTLGNSYGVGRQTRKR